MDANTTLIIIVLVFGAIVLIWALLFRGKGKAEISAGPVKMSVEGESADVDAATASDVSGGVAIEDARAGGGILAEADDGGGVTMKRVRAEDDIIATSSASSNAPKA
jgi:hypothetical protein